MSSTHTLPVIFALLLATTAMVTCSDVQTRLYQHLYATAAKKYSAVATGHQRLVLLSSGDFLFYDNFRPKTWWSKGMDMSKRVLQNMFDIVDIIPNGAYTIDSSKHHKSLSETYSYILDIVKVRINKYTKSWRRSKC